jgi:PAS domain S-box-containing protein
MGRVGRVRTRVPRSSPRSSPAGDGQILEQWAQEKRLTPGELRVIEHSVRGLSNKEIGHTLGISLATARAHLANAFRKLGIASRGELAHLVFGLMEGKTAQLADERARLIEELRSERAVLERERSFLDAVLQQSPVGFVVADAATRKVVLTNDEAVRILGDRPATLEAYSGLIQATHPDGRALAGDERPLHRALFEGVAASADVVVTRPDGKTMALEIHAAPVRDRAGKLVAVLKMLVDVTAKKAAEADLLRAEKHARDVVEQREVFLRKLSMDLCQPAETLKHMAEGIAGGLALPGGDGVRQARITARHMAATARRVSTGLADIVEIGDLEAGRYVPRSASLDPRAIVHAAVRLALQLARESHVRLESRLPAELPFVVADPDKTARVFGTLLEHAIEVSPEHARIVVEASALGEAVRFTVLDEGPPLPHEHEKKIFDRTWLASVGAKRGFGLGFLLARIIMERQLGRLWAETTPQGTAFHFTLPIA